MDKASSFYSFVEKLAEDCRLKESWNWRKLEICDHDAHAHVCFFQSLGSQRPEKYLEWNEIWYDR